MAIRATATPPTHMDGLSMLEATGRISETTMIGRTITAPAITIRSEATASLLTRVALAAVGTWAAALVAAMEEASAVATAAVADIVEQLGSSNHA